LRPQNLCYLYISISSMYYRFLVIFSAINFAVCGQTHCRNESLGISDSIEANAHSALERVTFLKVNNVKNSAAAATYIIPVVFHVFHNGGISNVSESNILKQIAILNKEFRREQADTVFTPAAFKSLAAGLDIEFRLATRDPSGNCTNGINRIYTTMFSCGNIDSVCKLSFWPADKYLNIWMGESFQMNNPLFNSNGQCVQPGIGTWPWINYMKQGVVYTHYNINNIGVSTFQKGRTLVHEVGHFLNLRHIWGDSLSCSSDSVADTPPALTFNTSCPVFPRRPLNACGSSSLGEMYCNYMDYTFETCVNMFTAGQVSRMDACLNSTVGARNGLWSSANLQATGTADPYIYPSQCAPVPELTPYPPIVICAGDSVKFVDFSYGGQGSARSWNFYGNSSSSLSDSIVWVTYKVPGIFSVDLSKSLGAQTHSRTFKNKVTVLSKTDLRTVPYTNSFESEQDAEEWKGVNAENDTTWRVFKSIATTGTQAMGIANFNNGFPLTDEIISPAFNIQSVTSVKFTFKLSFAQQKSINKDNLKLQYTTDCGKSWQTIYNRSGGVLATTGVKAAWYQPNAAEDWRQDSVIFYVSDKNEVRFKFSFASDNGNNIFIDDINIESLDYTSLQEESRARVLLYPNPSQGLVELYFADKTEVLKQVSVVNNLGQHITHTSNLSDVSTYSLDLSACEPGIYHLFCETEGGREKYCKLVILK
jgi:hypothetical protein